MRESPRAVPADHGWTSEAASEFALGGFFAVVFVGFTLLAMGPLIKFDAYFNLDAPPRAWVPLLHVLDRIGQRAVCLPVLAVATLLVCRHSRSWRPAFLAAASVFSLNLVVLLLKVGLARGSPEAADPSFFSGGMAYPSGHSANIVLVYGLVPLLLDRYGTTRKRPLQVLWGVVCVLGLTMVVTSATLNWHWFADLVAGLLVGAAVLAVTSAVDRRVAANVVAAMRARKSP